MKIFTGIGYNYDFVTPRLEVGFTKSRGRLRDFGKKWGPLSGFAIGSIPHDAALVHAFNGVPMTRLPYVVSGESFIPRVSRGIGAAPVKRLVQRMLASDQCGLVAPISENAAVISDRFNAASSCYAAIRAKTKVIYPSVSFVNEHSEASRLGDGPIRLTFIGNHFGRKGGIAVLYLSDLLTSKRIEHVIEIVGRTEFNPAIWTDTRESYYLKELAIDRKSVVMHGRLDNKSTLSLLKSSHFIVLPTIDDTFGFSVLEGMACGAIPIVSGVRALPEIVENGRSGFILNVDTDGDGRWVGLVKTAPDRITDEYEARLDELQRSLARQAADIIERIADTSHLVEALSQEAIATIRRKFSPQVQAERWGAEYRRILRRA